MKSYSRETILEIRKALKDDAAGNKDCTMTDLDMACDMLGELLSIKHLENRLIDMCKIYFAHPHTCSKTKKKAMRKNFREVLKKHSKFILD